jgi:hypothetical protein
VDIASLGIAIESKDAQTAQERLDRLHGTSVNVERSNRALSLSANDLKTALTGLANQAQLNNAAFTQTQSMLDGMLLKLEQTRAKISESTLAFQEFVKVQTQVDALGRTFGQNSVAMEQFERQARQLGFTAEQTASAMQRISAALENQTALGREARRSMQELGISLQGMGVNDIAKAFEQITDRMRNFRDTAGRFRVAQDILGPLTPDAFGKIADPQYVPIETREARQRQSEFDQRVAESAREAAYRARDNQRAQQRYDDLSGSYNVNSYGPFGLAPRLSTSDRARLGRELGPLSMFNISPGSQAGDLAAMEWMAANPNDPLARGRRTWSRTIGDAWRGTGIPDWWQWQFSGGFDTAAANMDQDIITRGMQNLPLSQRQRTRLTTGALENIPGPLGLLSSLTGRVSLGMGDRYATPRQDLRERTPQEIAEMLLGEFGDGARASQRLQLSRQMLMADGARRDDVLGAYRGAFGDEWGADRFAARRHEMGLLDAAMRTPGGMEEAGLLDQQWLMGQPMEQRGLASRMAAFTRSELGVQMPGMVWGRAGFSLGDLMSGTSGGPGVPSAALLAAFRRNEGMRQGQSIQAMTESQGQFMAGQEAIRNAIPGGSAAVQQEAAAQQALQAAIAAKLSVAERDIAVANARERASAQLTTQLEQEAQQQNLQLQALEERDRRFGGAGSDPVSRRAAGLEQDIRDAQVQAEDSGRADPSGRMRFRYGREASIGARDIVAASEQELNIQRRLLAVANERQGAQDSLLRSIEVERQFEEQMAKARASDDPDRRVREVQRAIEETKRLRDEIAAVNREAAMFKLGQDAGMEADFQDYIRSLPANQRAFARTPIQRQIWEQQRGYGGAAAPTDPGMGALEPGAYSAPGGIVPTPRDMTAPRGIRNNNPLNLSYLPNQGATGSDGRFGVYASMEEGIAASVRQLLWNADQHGLGTIGQQIGRWAPPGENNTGAYAARVASAVGIGVNDPLNIRDPLVLRRMVGAMTAVENGRSISDDVIARGVGLGLGPLTPGQTFAAGEDRRNVVAGQNTAINDAVEASNRLLDIERRLAEAREVNNKVAVEQLTTERQVVQQQISAGQYSPEQRAAAAGAINRERIAGFYGQLGSQYDQSYSNIMRSQLIMQGYQAGGMRGGMQAEQTADLQMQLNTMQQRRQVAQTGSEEARALDDLIAQLTKVIALRKTEADAAQQLNTTREMARTGQQMELMQADLAGGMFSWGPSQNRRVLEAQISQRFQNEGENDTTRAWAQQQRDLLDLKTQLEDVNAARQTFQGMGNAAFAAFQQIAVGGAKADQVMKQLLQTIAGMAAQQFMFRPLMNMFGGLFGGGGGGGGGIGDGGQWDLLPASPSASAMGNVFVGGNMMRFATGGVIDRPTFFPMANGGTGLAGEVGEEAIMPLRRLPNGRLGVEAAGGAGGNAGTNIQINMPMTIQGSAIGENGISPGALAQVRTQMGRAAQEMVRTAIDKEMRDGGRLSGVRSN